MDTLGDKEAVSNWIHSGLPNGRQKSAHPLLM